MKKFITITTQNTVLFAGILVLTQDELVMISEQIRSAGGIFNAVAQA